MKTREAAKQETRGALIAAALAEFAERGLDNPSLDAICARAGYTRGAFYVHFRDRDDLLVAVMEHAMGAFIDAVIATGDEAHDLEHTVARFTSAVAAAIGPVPGRRGKAALVPLAPGVPFVPFSRLLESVSRSPELRERFAALLRGAITRLTGTADRGQSARTVRRDVEPQQVAFLLVAVALGLMVAVDAGLPLDPAATHATTLRLLAPSGSGR